jgi:hypothetical protein
MKVAHVAGDVHGGDLARAFAVLVEATDDPRNDQTSMVRARSERDEVAVRLHLLDMAGKVQNSLLLFPAQN